IENDLPRVCPALLRDRARLTPDDLGATSPEAPIAAERQLPGRPVRLAIATLHRADAPPVAARHRTNSNRAGEDGEVVREAQIGGGSGGVGGDLPDRLVLEEACHGARGVG